MTLIPFSAIVADPVHGITFELLDRPFEGPRPANLSWGSPPSDLDAWFCHERGPEAAGIITIPQAHVFGSTLVYIEMDGEPHALEVDQNFLASASATNALAEVRTRRAAGTLRIRDIEGDVILLSGFPYGLYGHWMVDFMPRLQMLRMTNRKFAELRFLLPADLPAFAHEWLLLAGIKPAQLILYDQADELCRCERALMPTNLRAGGRALPSMAEAAAWMTQIACTNDISPTRLLYVSRENWGNITRKLENYRAIENVMAEYGFEIVFPEKLSVSGQADLLASAKCVAGDYGSGLHNTIFSRPGTSVIALRGIDLHPGFLQSGLCEIRRQPLSYVFGRTWANEQGFQHYEIMTDDLRRCLDAAMAMLSSDL
ncbi:glycosyltransferase family 61 protein [Sphingomonas abietis]|uniref:Glycosyltransferase family 61 protein n=1 Tax=Sphingomonas abietis TaxID=3012344 RepID=A0ABY7NVQ6_9SPHN|nr:glycosyltransferase family 61 protein [Sphingomonas abietis]WBO24511.1 glycosyltransferase family 61 protein [Sphingomonas abietis]